jgi:hypothetical protein
VEKIEYHDERVWPHMFPNTLEYIPYNGGRYTKKKKRLVIGKT